MKTKLLIPTLLCAILASSTQAADLPHATLVTHYVMTGQSAKDLARCEGAAVSAPRQEGSAANCWAAQTAADLAKQPASIRAFVLNSPIREAALSRCRAMSGKERFASEECASAAHAHSFIGLRLPSMRDTLKPVQWNKGRSVN